jgi:outer membrane protein TolC
MPEDFSTRVESELRQVAAPDTELVLVRTPDLDGQWDPARARQALQAALDNPDVDYVLAVGAGVSNAAVGIALSKPVVATYVQRPDFGGIHEQANNRSQTENLIFMELPHLIATDLGALRSIFPFPETAHLLLPESYIGANEALDSEIQALEQAAGVRIELVPLGDSVSESAARLPTDAVAAFIGRTPQWAVSDRRELFDTLTARGVPTYGLVGHTDVEAGALAGRTPDVSQLVARRAALNLNELIRGGSTDALPVLLDADPELVINGRTAVALNYVPTYETLVTARFLYEDVMRRDEKRLSFPETLIQANGGNAFLRASEQAVQTSYHSWKLAKSPLLPQAFAGLAASGRNVRGLEGLIPDKVLNGGFSVRQMIYDDARVTDYKSEGRLYQGSQEGFEVDRLDVLADAGGTFLNLVLSEILFRVEADNLRLTRDNLELSKVRLDAGYSGLDEVYRWESELNSRQSTLFISRADIEEERIALNQVLGLDQFLRWRPDEIDVDPKVFPFLGGGLSGYLSDPQKMERFRAFLVQFALQNAPELLFLQSSLEAQQLQLDQRKRRWYLPVFDTGFRWGYDIARTPELPDLERSDWMWDIQALYPIFEGGRRAEDEKLNVSELTRIEKEVIDVRQVIERRVRSSVRAIEGSFPSIGYLNAAAEAARRNFEIVQDRYTEGLVNVTDLLDAQNDRFTTERTARGAQYAFLLDMVALQRAIAWFEDMKTKEERDQLLAEARAYIDNPTPPPAGEAAASVYDLVAPSHEGVRS